MLHGWDNFFMTAGAASATLIGLLFVAITLGAGLSTARGKFGASAFLTPTLVHLGSVLLQCLTALVPWPTAWPLGIIAAACGLIGLAYQMRVILMQRRIDFASPDWLDWTLFSAAPALGYAVLIAGAAGLIADEAFAPYAVAGAITLLLFAGVYGAWDLTLWIARNRDEA